MNSSNMQTSGFQIFEDIGNWFSSQIDTFLSGSESEENHERVIMSDGTMILPPLIPGAENPGVIGIRPSKEHRERVIMSDGTMILPPLIPGAENPGVIGIRPTTMSDGTMILPPLILGAKNPGVIGIRK